MSRATGRALVVGLLLALLLVVGEIRYAEPIADGDLFWHLAYARQMIEGHTLVPDPTLYSWTPASTAIIYCAWIAELALYAVWSAFGWAGLFALRYVIIAAVAVIYWSTLRRARLRPGPVTLLALLLLVVTAYFGSLLKPELFSLLLFHGILACYFRAKMAAREGRDPRPWLYSVPLLTLIWANTHGAHVLLAPLLVASAVGEALTLRFAPAIGFSRRQYGHLLCAWALCALAVCLTPYGFAYPLQNIDALLDAVVGAGRGRPDIGWNEASGPIYSEGAWRLFSLPQLFIALAVACIVGFVAVAHRCGRRGRVDYSLLLGLLVYLPPSVLIVRVSYIWPALACYALAYLAYLARKPANAPASDPPSPWYARVVPFAAAAAFVALSARTVYDAYARPLFGSWVGFGIGYINPVPEGEVLAHANLGPRFYNLFNSGGYLLWRLYPQYRVMVDGRSFPYLSWFDDQYRFTRGANFDDFVARYPADLAVIELRSPECWLKFAASADWRLLFYGPSAVIFVRSTPLTNRIRPHVAAAVLELKNARAALSIFDFAVVAGDYRTAWQVLAQLESTLAWQVDRAQIARLQDYRAAHQALAHGDYDRAETLLESALAEGLVAERDVNIRTLLRSRRRALERGDAPSATAISAEVAKRAAALLPPR